MHKLSDEQLMDLVVDGDGLALDSLYQRFANSLTRLAQRVVQDRAAAEEIVQETFWRVWKNAESFNVQRGSFRNWVHSINQRLAIDTLRRRKVRPQPARSEIEEAQMKVKPDEDMDVPGAAWDSIMAEQLRSAVEELPPEQKRVIDLAYFKGLSRREIAEQTGDPLGTVHTRARLALKKLREMLFLYHFDNMA